MTEYEAQRPRVGSAAATAPLAPLIAASLTLGALTALWLGPWRVLSPDWTGYEALWLDSGGWLVDAGRAPGFVALLRVAGAVFGSNGYEAFRLVLFAAFAAFAVALAWRTAEQRRLGALGPLAAATVIVGAFALKAVVQIREGVAFVLVLAPLLLRARGGPGKALVGALLGATVHDAALVFAPLAAAAAALARLSDARLLSPRLPRLMTIGGALVGLALGFAAMGEAGPLLWALRDFGVDTSAEVVGGTAKFAYWIGLGAAAASIRQALLRPLDGERPFGFAYALLLGAALVPMLWFAAATLVFAGFAIPALTSMAVRLLLTALELALVLAAIRGRLGWATWAAAALVLASELRLFVLPA